MYIIPINTNTLDLIEELNNGVRPEIEKHKTFFVWDQNEPADIWTEEQVTAHDGSWLCAPVKMLRIVTPKESS